MTTNGADKIIQEAPPPALHHYTSQKGLIGMIESRKMWASNIFYLNDATEYTYASDLILKILSCRLVAITGEEHPRKRSLDLLSASGWHDNRKITDSGLSCYDRQCIFIESIMKLLEDLKKDYEGAPIYILSFTGWEDDISQWRGYCPHGMGFCLEFETSSLIEQMKKFDLAIVRCLYKAEEQEQEIRNILAQSIDALKTAFDNFDKPEDKEKAIKDVKFKAVLDFLRLMPRLKDKAFKDENEWRFISAEKKFSTKFREGTSMVVPYVEIPLAGADAAPTEIIEPIKIIKRILVGPTPHKMLSKKSVESLLKINKMEGCKVELSNVPYRTW
ncbi:MAG: DUF2971 domain-containing protein [Thermodesulfovibrionales bacterium]